MLAHLLGLLVLSGQAAPPELNDQTYAKWRDHIRPKPAELNWETVPWRPVFGEGMVEAQEKNMPVLIWVMNGHPLACT